MLTASTLDPWCRYMEILVYDTPLHVVQHTAGWVIVQCQGCDYTVCDGPFSSRKEARETIEEWRDTRKMLREMAGVPPGHPLNQPYEAPETP
jgi:hypothetical protein